MPNHDVIHPTLLKDKSENMTIDVRTSKSYEISPGDCSWGLLLDIDMYALAC